MIPQISDGVVVVQHNDRFVAINPDIPNWVVMDTNGAYVLALCDGSRCEAEIVRHLSELGDTVAEITIPGFLSLLRHKGILISGSEDDVEALLTEPVESGLTDIALFVNEKCNMRCAYCLSDSKAHGTNELSLDDVKEIVRQVDRVTGGRQAFFNVLGGEPLLHRRIIDIGREISSAGHQVNLVTNGTLVTAAIARAIAEAFSSVVVSIDGTTAEAHGAARDARTFPKVERAVELLRAAGADVSVSMTVTAGNLSNVPEFSAKYCDLRQNIVPVIPVGRGVAARHLRVSGADFRNAVAQAGHSSERARAACLGHGRKRRRCGAGAETIAIGACGDVFPCQMLMADELNAGDFRKTSLSDILASGIFDRVTRVSVDTISECRSCVVRYICGGSCRAWGYFENGTLDGPGGVCDFYRESFFDYLFENAEMQVIGPNG